MYGTELGLLGGIRSQRTHHLRWRYRFEDNAGIRFIGHCIPLYFPISARFGDAGYSYNFANT
jgi:hypothetical protein